MPSDTNRKKYMQNYANLSIHGGKATPCTDIPAGVWRFLMRSIDQWCQKQER
jgi:hypothetical protein